MATSKRQVQRITNNSSVSASDCSRIFSKLPISPSSFEMPPNQVMFALAQHTIDAVASIQTRVRFCHKSSFGKCLQFLHISTKQTTCVLSSCKTFPSQICAVVEC